MSACKTATEFSADHLAIGLSIANNDHSDGLDELLAGKHDYKIRHLAKLFTYVEGHIFLRIGYKFNGLRNQGYEGAEKFKTTWNRIIHTLRAESLDNFLMIWQSAASRVNDIIEKRPENIGD